MARVYWANALFSAADRRFNEACAGVLRASGHDVLLPQAGAANAQNAPTPEVIFRADATELLSCDFLVACLDQETIDSGVACEIGLAYAAGIPVLALLTDMRQFRQGEGRIYKNPFVIGAIERVGGVFSSVEELAGALAELSAAPRESAVHFDQVASMYDDFVDQLESWYEPRWTTPDCIEDALGSLHRTNILEVGCGTGRVAARIADHIPEADVLGFDPAEEMILAAKNLRDGRRRLRFTSSKTVVDEAAAAQGFDTIVTTFALHDIREKSGWFRWVSGLLRVGGELLIVDLSAFDLSHLGRLLRQELAAPVGAPDPRLNPAALAAMAAATGFETTSCSLFMPSVTFKSPEDLSCFLTIFGVGAGFDFPLPVAGLLSHLDADLIMKACRRFRFPLIDRRAFVQWNLVLH